MARSMGIRDRAGRRADLRSRLRHRRPGRRGAVARSPTSAPTWARPTSSTPSWWWCSAASATSGAPASAALTLGIANKFLEPWCRRGAGQDPGAGVHHPVHPEAPARPVRAARAGRRRHDGRCDHAGTGSAGRRACDRGCTVAVALLACRRRRAGAEPGGAAGSRPARLAPTRSPCSASTCATRCWPSRWIWSGATAASSASATAPSSRSAATPWACT